MTQEIEIECGGLDKQRFAPERHYRVIIEGRDRDVFERVKKHPGVQGKKGKRLVDALMAILPPGDILSVSFQNTEGQPSDGPKGEPAYQKFSPRQSVARAQWNGGELKDDNLRVVVTEHHYIDGKLCDTFNGIPAVQEFSESSGGLLIKKHYRDGMLNDSSDGTAAVQEFSESSGNLVVKGHYKEGLLNDAVDGGAALQTFDDKGELIVRRYYADGKLNDGKNGEPAVWEVDPKNGFIKIWHYKDDQINDALDGTPAYQGFISDGKLLSVKQYKEGKLNDAADGSPAVLVFSELDGALYAAWRFKNDKSEKELSRFAKHRVEKKKAVKKLKELHP